MFDKSSLLSPLYKIRCFLRRNFAPREITFHASRYYVSLPVKLRFSLHNPFPLFPQK